MYVFLLHVLSEVSDDEMADEAQAEDIPKISVADYNKVFNRLFKVMIFHACHANTMSCMEMPWFS